jgi:peptidase E
VLDKTHGDPGKCFKNANLAQLLEVSIQAIAAFLPFVGASTGAMNAFPQITTKQHTHRQQHVTLYGDSYI